MYERPSRNSLTTHFQRSFVNSLENCVEMRNNVWIPKTIDQLVFNCFLFEWLPRASSNELKDDESNRFDKTICIQNLIESVALHFLILSDDSKFPYRNLWWVGKLTQNLKVITGQQVTLGTGAIVIANRPCLSGLLSDSQIVELEPWRRRSWASGNFEL